MELSARKASKSSQSNCMITEEEIRKLYPEFDYWVHKDKGFICAGHGEYHIMLWYEFLKQRKEQNERNKI